MLSVTIAAANNGGQGYAALDFNQSGGYVPPDTCGAAGPAGYVETVNQTVALYGAKETGTPAVTSSLSSFWFTTGRLARADGGSSLSDPIVAYDDQIGRFIVGDQDVDFSTHVSTFDIAVSRSSNPGSLSTSDWSFYQIRTTETGYDADYPGNFGYNHDAFVFTLNMFGSVDHTQVVSISCADLAAGVAPSALHVYANDLNDFSLRPTVMHDSAAGDPMWLVTEHGDGRSIDVIKETNVLSSSASFAYTNLAVTPYSAVAFPRNPNGTVITNNLDSRVMKAAEWNGTLVASQTVGVSSTQDAAQWYAIDLAGGTPVLADQGRVSAGNNTYLTFPSIDINAAGQVGMTYMKSGTDSPTDYLSMVVTGRDPGDPAGTMETPVIVPAGTGQANYKDYSSGGRAGDLSGMSVDPTDGSFWAANEFANTEPTANWGTAVANFTIGSPLTATDVAVTASGPSSVTAGSSATYAVTVVNNGPASAQGLVLTDVLPAGSTFVSLGQSAGTDGFSISPSGQSVTAAATGSLAPGASDTFTLVVLAPANLANGAPFNDTAAVQAANPDPSTANNTATVAGSILNTSANADLVVALSGPGSASEGNTVTYTVTVTNNGPIDANGVVLTDTFPALLNALNASASQGTWSVSSGLATFLLGTVPAGASFTATVTAQALEDGSASVAASATAQTPDPNVGNNGATVATSLAEPAISVSGRITTRSRTLTNSKTATFTHAGGIEPAGNFVATINWGDGRTSSGTITKSGTTYVVTGSHTYYSGGRHTITTTVTESGNAPDKYGDSPGSGSWREQDVVHLPSGAWNPTDDTNNPGHANPPVVVCLGEDPNAPGAGGSDSAGRDSSPVTRKKGSSLAG